MIRLFSVTFTLMLLFIGAMSACAPVQPVSGSSSQGNAAQNGQTSDGASQCLAVPNQVVVRHVAGDSARSTLANNQVVQRIMSTLVVRGQITIPVSSGDVPPTVYTVYEGARANELATVVVNLEDSDGNQFGAGQNLHVRMVEGADHSPSQSPFAASPSYIPITIATGITVPATVFTEQAALTTIANTQIYSAHRPHPGIHVNIAVFDSSPYTVTLLPQPYEELIIPADPQGVMTPIVYYSTIDGPARDHGLFVSSLAQQVAPDAQIHLYRVLNEQGVGNIFSLVAQMQNFLRDVHFNEQLTNTDGVTRSVANLSLSIACDPDDVQAQGSPSYTESIKILDDAIDQMHQAGVVIVAAAGNEATITGTSSVPRPEQSYPASHEHVIGVGATAVDGPLATCYSNKADIFAPGGAAGGNNCQAQHHECRLDDVGNLGQCEWGLVGLSTASSSRLAFWSGTSFAAPLVSGLMARWLGAPNAGLQTIPTHDYGPVLDTDALQRELLATFVITTDTPDNGLPYTYSVLSPILP